MNAPRRNQPKTQPSFLQHQQTGSLEAVRKCIIGSAEARKAFDGLVKANCEDGMLLILLAEVSMQGPALDTWKARFGVSDSRQLKSAIKRIRQSADDFENLDREGLLRLAAWPTYRGQLTEERFLDRITGTPAFLRACADSIEAAAKSPGFKPRRHGFSNTALAHLVAYVQGRTTAPHDNKVSALLNAIGKTGRKKDDPYTADALKTWRDEHAKMIRQSVQMFPSVFGK